MFRSDANKFKVLLRNILLIATFRRLANGKAAPRCKLASLACTAGPHFRSRLGAAPSHAASARLSKTASSGDLAAVVDWWTRRVLYWRVAMTLEVDSCVEAVEEALARNGRPKIFNTDKGGQFTSTNFIAVSAKAEVEISMDGRGARRDNVFVERLWRTIKNGDFLLRAYAGVSDARTSIGRNPALYDPVSLRPSVYATQVNRFC
jgi:transposase InsO family protein